MFVRENSRMSILVSAYLKNKHYSFRPEEEEERELLKEFFYGAEDTEHNSRENITIHLQKKPLRSTTKRIIWFFALWM